MPGQEMNALQFLRCPEQPHNRGKLFLPALCLRLNSGQTWLGKGLKVPISLTPETVGSAVKPARQAEWSALNTSRQRCRLQQNVHRLRQRTRVTGTHGHVEFLQIWACCTTF